MRISIFIPSVSNLKSVFNYHCTRDLFENCLLATIFLYKQCKHSTFTLMQSFWLYTDVFNFVLVFRPPHLDCLQQSNITMFSCFYFQSWLRIHVTWFICSVPYCLNFCHQPYFAFTFRQSGHFFYNRL